MLVAVLLVGAKGLSLGQVESALPFLLLPSSPETFGMGGVSSAFESSHPLSAIQNPAQLGFNSRENFVTAGMLLPTSTAFPNVGLPDLSYYTLGLNAGMNLGGLVGLPLSVGLGYSRVYLDWGEFVITSSSGPAVIDKFHPYESSDNISLGVGVDYWVRFGAGASIKFINSHLSSVGTEQEKGDGSASVTAWDLGLLLTIPLASIAEKAGVSLEIPSAHVVPLLDFTLGGAKNNIGDEVVYIDPAQADPLPRQVSLAAGLEAGIVSTAVPEGWKLVTGSLVSEANDILVERHSDGTWDYLGGAGDIKFFNDVVAGKDNPAITQRKGWKLELGELFSLRGGSVHEPAYPSGYRTYYTTYTTSGFGIRLSGLWKALRALGVEENHSWITFMRENIDLRFDYAKSLYAGEAEGISFSSVSLIVKKMPF